MRNVQQFMTVLIVWNYSSLPENKVSFNHTCFLSVSFKIPSNLILSFEMQNFANVTYSFPPCSKSQTHTHTKMKMGNILKLIISYVFSSSSSSSSEHQILWLGAWIFRVLYSLDLLILLQPLWSMSLSKNTYFLRLLIG